MKLKQLLYEAGILDKYAFANNSDIRNTFYGDVYEPNNEFEDNLYEALMDWLWGSKDIKLYSLIKKYYYKLITHYPEIFKPKTPNESILYRGLRKPIGDITSIIRNTTMDDWEKSDFINGGYKYKKPIKYTPNKLLQSWSSELTIAKDFGESAILQTTQNSEFFMNSDVLSYIYDGTNEYECIHFDKSYSDPIFLHISERLLKFNRTTSNATTEEMLDYLSIKNYTINEDGSVDVDGDVDLSSMALAKIPIKFRTVTGRFDCSNNQLLSLENSPKSVGKDFICSINPKLKTLVGAPQSVGKDFYCMTTPKLKTLRGAENMFVYGDFYCENNPNMESLDYLPKNIAGKVYSDI